MLILGLGLAVIPLLWLFHDQFVRYRSSQDTPKVPDASSDVVFEREAELAEDAV